MTWGRVKSIKEVWKSEKNLGLRVAQIKISLKLSLTDILKIPNAVSPSVCCFRNIFFFNLWDVEK